MEDFAPNSTSFFGNLVAIRQAIESYGIDADSLIKSVGINQNEYHPTGKRVPCDLTEAITIKAADVTGDEAFGLRLVESATPNTHHALSSALLYSSNLRSFFQRFERFWSLVTTLYRVELAEQRTAARFSLIPTNETDERLLHIDGDTFCGLVLKYMRYVTGSKYIPKRVELTRPEDSKYSARYANFFGCDLKLTIVPYIYQSQNN